MLFLSFFRREFLFFQLRAYPLDRPQPFREQPKKRKLQHNFFSRGKYIPPNVFLSLFFCCSKEKKGKSSSFIFCLDIISFVRCSVLLRSGPTGSSGCWLLSGGYKCYGWWGRTKVVDR
jgi:hypothetical protein